MVDQDLARLYGVETFNLNKAVKRNRSRFPPDFMFQLTVEEATLLTFQIGISKSAGRGGRRTPPYVFTQEGVAMLSSVLKSERSIQVNVAIMRTFVGIKKALNKNKELLKKITDLETKYEEHDDELKTVFLAIRKIIQTGIPKTKRIAGLGE